MNTKAYHRGGLTLNKRKQAIVWVIGILMGSGLAMNGYAANKFLTSVQQICSAYEMPINPSDMEVVTHQDGVRELIITLRSSRNSFDRCMLIGFYAAGKAMQYHQEKIDFVKIIVEVEYKESANITATAGNADIFSYLAGSLSSSEFVRRLKFS